MVCQDGPRAMMSVHLGYKRRSRRSASEEEEVTRRSETAGAAFCMKGLEQTTSQMTAVHCDQKHDRASLLGCRGSQNGSVGGLALECGDGVGSCICEISLLIAVDFRHLLTVFRSQKAIFINAHAARY